MPYKDIEEAKEHNNQYKLLNREKVLKQRAEYRSNNKQQIEEYNKQYNEFGRKIVHKKKKEFIDNYKLSKGCSVCGYNKCARALDFHHNGDKEFNISQTREISLDRIKIEMDKCIILCANCHSLCHSKKL